MVLGVGIACVTAYVDAGRRRLYQDNIILLAAFSFGFALFGAKIAYILVTYRPREIMNLVWTGQWNTLIGTGGLVFYGGLIFSVIGVKLGALYAHCRLEDYLPSIVPVIPLGHAFGRVGCAFAGCCYGFAYSKAGAIPCIHELDGVQTTVMRFPVQFVEAAGCLLISYMLFRKRRKVRNSLELCRYYIALYAAMRFVLEYLRGDAMRGMCLGLSTSQWISAALLGIVGRYFFTVKRK